jgi:hypothetical protein
VIWSGSVIGAAPLGFDAPFDSSRTKLIFMWTRTIIYCRRRMLGAMAVM